ncbi:MAG TPA: DUF4440 domain-containing protein [Acidobacteriaceae bacterium]|jgi:hypothetical protein|nr:DUF4440 domain-containing protein [Acidobacteriaceae bacterium]
MGDASEFAQVEAGSETVLEELRRLEPIFHTAEFGTTVAEFDRRMAAEYWEVGASGRRYSREFILRTLEEMPPVDAAAAGWTCSEFGLRAMGADTWLLTYTLDQGGRATRRSTLWGKTEGRWRILFHQGTVVTGGEGFGSPGPARV